MLSGRSMSEYFDHMLGSHGHALYAKVCAEKGVTEGAKPLYAMYAFYCERLCGRLVEDPDYAVSEDGLSNLEAIIALADRIGIPETSWDE